MSLVFSATTSEAENRRVSSTAQLRFRIAAVLLSCIAALGFYLAPSVPFGVAWDEPIKVSFILRGTQDFTHPILMLQLVRVANLFVQATQDEQILRLGRLLAATSGGLFVLSTVLISRRVVGSTAAIGAGVLTAAVPITLLHAQLLKEDIFLAPWLMFGLLAMDRLRAKPDKLNAVLFGLTAGLSSSAKYTGFVLLPLSLALPAWAEVRSSRYYRMLGLAALIAFTLFCAVNFPLFVAPGRFALGFRSSVHHALSGHLIALYPWQTGLLFTWKANIWPGVGAPVAIAAILGMCLAALQWPSIPALLRSLLIFGFTWYLMHELSPMKPYPEGARHMVVMAGVLSIFTAYGVQQLAAHRWPSHRSIATALILACIVAIPLYSSYKLARDAQNDTYIIVQRLVARLSGPILFSGIPNQPSVELAHEPNLEKIARFLVINDAYAEQYLLALELSGESKNIRLESLAYSHVMTRPALLITSTTGCFATRNVPYRIIALEGDPLELVEAAKTFAGIPGVQLRLVWWQNTAKKGIGASCR